MDRAEELFPHRSTRALIVGVSLPDDLLEGVEESLNELEMLLRTLDIEVVGRVCQKRQKLVPATLIGTGKIHEISEWKTSQSADLVVFDHALSPPQVRNLERELGCAISDRSGVILEIFARHAKTKEAKTQVEIARLEYLLPRLTGAWTHFQRQTGGGVTARGMGETQIEIDRRRARERIARLQRDLEAIRRERATQRKSRRSALRVALVGYTNSGKTSVMCALTKAQTLPEDKLFATLDTSVRVIDPPTRPKILLTDTVGFIHNLPHSLVESFKSTFDEVLEADLLLHVVDISHPRFREQMETTAAVLQETGLGQIPVILVFNKCDLLQDTLLPRIVRKTFPDSIAISCEDTASIQRLHEMVWQFFEKNLIRATVELAANDQETLSRIYQSCYVERLDYETPGSVRITLQGTRAAIGRLGPAVLKRAGLAAMSLT